MNVNLGNVFDKFIAELLQGGLYQSQSEVVRDGLRLLKEREELKKLRLAELRRQIAIGSEQADRGEFVGGQEPFAEIHRRRKDRKQAFRDLAATVAEIRQEAKEKGIDKMSMREINAAVAAARRDIKKNSKRPIK